MSFNATAIRKRPQAFEALKGQNFVVATIKSAIENNKIAHAYLFAGPRGVGKTTSARLLAKALCCEHGPTPEPCGECSICKSITNGSASDVIEIDGASNTSVDDIRAIKEELMFPPQYSRYKIYIIDEVHMLSTSAFNALLKTIEEPPEWAIFIFATTELQKVPLTIQSRCQTFRFRSIDESTIAGLITTAAKDDGITIDKDSVHWISKRARGSARDAYTLFDQCVAFANGNITYDKIKTELGITGPDELKAIFESAISEDTTTAINALHKLYENGVSAESFTIDMASYLRDVLLINAGIENENILYNSLEYYNKGLISSLSRESIETSLNRFLQLFRNIKYSLNAMYEVELEISRLSSSRFILSNEEITKRLEYLKNALVNESKNINPSLLLQIQKAPKVIPSAPLQVQAQTVHNTIEKDVIQVQNAPVNEIQEATINTKEPQTVKPSTTPQNVNTGAMDKDEVALSYLQNNLMLYRAFKDKQRINFDGGMCTITLQNQFDYDTMNESGNLSKLSEALRNAYGFSGKINIVFEEVKKSNEETTAMKIAKFFDGKEI